MDWWARRSFYVDLAAKSYLKIYQRADQPFIPIQLQYKHWAVYCKKSSNIFHSQTTKYWNTHYCIPVPYQCTIHLKANQLAKKKLTPAKRIFVTKFCTSYIGVGHTLKYRDYKDHSRCPRCGYKEEKTNHVLSCLDSQTKRKYFKKAVKKIVKPVFEETKTEPKLSAIILDIIFLMEKEPTNSTYQLFHTL